MVWTRHREYGIITRMGMFLTAWLFWAAVISQIGQNLLRSPIFYRNFSPAESLTSTGYRFPEGFARTVKRYGQFERLYREEYSTALPGLSYTSMGEAGSRHMVPQGICIAGDYMLITAYDNKKTEKSVVYVLSNRGDGTHSFLTTLILPDKNHVGGIAFDGDNVWIAKSTSGYVSALPYGLIEEAAACGQDSFRVEAYEQNLYCGVTASFVSYYDDRLWVGTYRSPAGRTGALNSYRMEREGDTVRLQWESAAEIPAYAQGIAFLQKEDRTYALISTSCGRYRDSRVYLRELVQGEGEFSLAPVTEYRFPPMAEEVASDGEHTYVIFESAATCYSNPGYGRCAYPVDRVSALSNRAMLTGLP